MRVLSSAISILFVACAGSGPTLHAADAIAGVAARVWFSPHGGCTEAIVAAVGSAQLSIRVQAYSFTSQAIAKALKSAKGRGVDVRVIVDKSQRTETYSVCDFLAHAGIPILVDEQPAIAHSKVIVIDGTDVLTGSFNFTSAAETKNVENLLQLHSKELASAYLDNWTSRAAVSTPYVPIDSR